MRLSFALVKIMHQNAANLVTYNIFIPNIHGVKFTTVMLPIFLILPIHTNFQVRILSVSNINLMLYIDFPFSS